MKFDSIDTLTIKKAIEKDKSELINNLTSKKFYKNDSTWNYGISYFYEKGDYNFQVKDYNVKDTIALTIPDIYQIERINPGSLIVFDTDTSFYHVGWYINKRVVSKKHFIKNT